MFRTNRSALLLLTWAVLSVPLLLGQQGTVTDTRSAEERLRAVETEQQYMRQALKDSQETTRFLITGFAALMVLIQVISSVMQARREDRAYANQARREDELGQRHVKRENELETLRQQREKELETLRRQQEDELETLRRQREDELDARRSNREHELFTFWTEREKQLDLRRMEREDRLDAMTGSSVQGVKNVLDVVSKTFEERRKAEEEGRKAAESFNDRIKELTGTINTLNTKIRDLEGFAVGVRCTVENERHALEQRALSITKSTPRHLFRQRGPALAEFAHEYDSFLSKQGLPETATEDGAGFTVYVSYIRGIAAHYGNDPKLATTQLTRVSGDMKEQPGEDAAQRDKRRAVAYYYLGITESNFANYDKAIEAFQRAIDLETSPKDVLSRLVAAEAAALANRVIDAGNYLQQVDEILKELRD
jgi:tetratricopeptide (TPR) repeat protein